ncbi:MAG: glycosyltransferase family 4 protein [Chloroflexota bacterium]
MFPDLKAQVYLVGLRYKHHARHSGYEAYGRYVATSLAPPVNFRWTLGKWGWPVNQAIARLTRHPWYSLGAHLTEWSTLRHMMRDRNRLYHVLYGDSDLWLLRRAHRRTDNRLIASFHQPPHLLRDLSVIEPISKHLDAVILVSESQRTYFEEFLPARRVFVIPLGVDTTFFRPPQTKSHRLHCITVGSHLRDFATLKEAIQLVWQANPEVTFTAVGTRREKKAYFPPLEDRRIQFLEGIDDESLLQAYQESSLAVFSFQAATANSAICEAMATGLPIVATRTGGTPEYITPDTGILCPPQRPEKLAAAILQILNAPKRQQTMGTASRRRALKLDLRVIARQMAKIYTKVLGDDRRASALVHGARP